MKNFSLRSWPPALRFLDWWLLLLLLAAATPAVVFRHQNLFLAPPLDLLDGSWLLDTSYKASTNVWFGRDVLFTYGPAFQWLSSAPARWLGVSTGTVFATWYTLPLLVVIVATFLSARLLFAQDEPGRRALFFFLAVVFWSVPDVRASVALLAFLLLLRLADYVATDGRSLLFPAIAAAIIGCACFLLSTDTGIYCMLALMVTVASEVVVMWRVGGAVSRLAAYLAMAVAVFAGLMLLTNTLLTASPFNFTFWRSSLTLAGAYRWFEAVGMPRSGKRVVLLVLAAGAVVFLSAAWSGREVHSRRLTLRPTFLLSGFCMAFVMMQSGLVRSDPGHVQLAIFPMIFLGGAVLIAGRPYAPITSTATISATLILTLILGHAYWIFRPYSVLVKVREIVRPLVSCPAGYELFDRACFLPGDRQLLSQVSGYVDEHTAANHSVAIFPYETAFGLTSRRPVAGGVLQSYLVNGDYLTAVELAGLRKANPPLALYFPDGILSQALDGIPNFTRSPELWFYLLRHYCTLASPAPGAVALTKDDSRDWRFHLSSQELMSPPGDVPVIRRNTWLDLGRPNWPESGADFLKLRLRVNYSPLWRLRKPSHLSLLIGFADGSQKTVPFILAPNHTTDVWFYPWNDAEMASFFNPDESQWRSAGHPAISSLKLYITRYDWISVVPSSISIQRIEAAQISLSSHLDQPALPDDQ